MKSAALLLSGLVLAVAALGASAQEAAPAPAAAKPDVAKGEATSNGVCVACHTNDGSRGSPANPILQGQHPEYLVKQLTEFKADKRQNPIMKGFASQLSEQDMKNVAAFYGSKQAKPGFAKNKDLVTLGEKIWRGGMGDRHIAACAGCHGPNGAGIPAQYPRLAGQHSDYTEAQLKAFRSGARKNSPQMTGITIEANANDEGHLYGSVAGPEVAKGLKAKGMPVDADMIKLEGPIKQCALYEVNLSLGYEIESKVTVMVVPVKQAEAAKK